MTKPSKIDGEALFPIGTVSEQTGVHSVTLRAWERRYGLLQPSRTPKGHRLYSQQDITRVRQVLRLLEQGIPVGRAREVLDSHSPHGLVCAEGLACLHPVQAGDDPWPQFAALCKRFICRLDTRSLEQVINEAVSLYSLERVARKLLLPLCRDLQGQCNLLASTRAEHAFWYEFLSAKLGTYYLHSNAQRQHNDRRVIILGSSCPMVYLQMLLLGGVLGGHGFQASLLGAGCSLEHLPLVLERSRFDAIIYCTPTTEVLEAMAMLSRLTTTLLLVQYLDPAKQETLPTGITLLPALFGEAAQQLDQLLAGSTAGEAV